MSTTTIYIRREGSIGIFTKYKVLIDGIEIGELSHGEKRGFSVAPGSHIVQVKLRNELSQPLTIEVNEGQSIELVCGQDQSKVWSFSITIPLYLKESGIPNSNNNSMQSTTPLAVELLGENNVIDSTVIIDVEEYPLDNRLGTDNLSVEIEISKTMNNEFSLESGVEIGGNANLSILSMLQMELSTNISKKYGYKIGQAVSRRQMLQFTVKAGSFVTYIVTWKRKVRTGNYIASIENQRFDIPYRLYYDLSYDIGSK